MMEDVPAPKPPTLDELIAEVQGHSADVQRSLRQVMRSHRKMCAAQQKGVALFGPTFGVSPDAMALSFAPKDD